MAAKWCVDDNEDLPIIFYRHVVYVFGNLRSLSLLRFPLTLHGVRFPSMTAGSIEGSSLNHMAFLRHT